MFEKRIVFKYQNNVGNSFKCMLHMRLNAENEEKLGSFPQCRSLETKGSFMMD